VKVQLGFKQIPDVTVQASKSSYSNTGGLCGMWDGDQNKELYVLDKNGIEHYLPAQSNVDVLAEFWK
jgi:hypothetical protein